MEPLTASRTRAVLAKLPPLDSQLARRDPRRANPRFAPVPWAAERMALATITLSASPLTHS
jgi:hypothetical protein